MTAEALHIIYVSEDAEFEAVYDIRAKVFQDEHGVPEELEVDGHDHVAHHYLALLDGVPVGTARWRITLGGKAKLERVDTLCTPRISSPLQRANKPASVSSTR